MPMRVAMRTLAAAAVAAAPHLVTAQPASESVLPPAAPPAGDSLSATPAVYVERIEVRGVTVIASDEIAEVTAPYEGRSVSSAELQELRAALSSLYLDRDFVNSGVVLPDQSVADGVIRYEAIEGELTRIDIEGDPRIAGGYVRKRLARHIDAPLNVRDVEHALRDLQDDPNIARLDARLAPGEGLGESVLRVGVDEPDRFEVGLGVNNHRATTTGSEEGNARFAWRNLTGFGEVVSLSTSLSEGADNTSIDVTVPVSRRDTTLRLYGADSDSSIVEARLRALDIESFTETRGMRIEHPLLDGLDRTFSMMLGYETRHSETTLAGAPFSLSPGAQNGVSETNVALLGFDWTSRTADRLLAARATFRHGSDYGDATVFEPQDLLDRLSNPTGADGRFDSVQTQLLYLKRLNSVPWMAGLDDRAELRVRMSGQLSQDPLMAIEKLAIGGVSTVRGFPENFMVRDNGLAVTIEFRLPLPGYSDSPSVRNVMLVPFIDHGRSWDEADTDPVSASRDTSAANSITGVGLGLVWEPVRRFRAELYLGADVDDDVDPGEDPRDFRSSNLQDDGVHFAVTYSRTW